MKKVLAALLKALAFVLKNTINIILFLIALPFKLVKWLINLK